MDQTTLNEILRKHRLWLKDDPNGERANLECADLEDADLRYADLEDANLKGANLRHADLICADLRYVNLRHANLEGAYLRYADLRCANLICADLRYVDLRHANLKGAYLRYADLRCANLKDADLICADLERADLEGADLTQTISQNIEDQKVISVQVDTSRVNNAISYWKDLGIWTTGCFQGTLDELQEKVAEAHKDNPFLRERYERVIEFILSEAEHDDKKPTSGN